MKKMISILVAAVATIAAPQFARAADLGGYEERETYVERPPIIERERVIVERHHYYEPRYVEVEPEVYYRPRRVYYYGGSPYFYGARFHHRHHWRGDRHW